MGTIELYSLVIFLISGLSGTYCFGKGFTRLCEILQTTEEHVELFRMFFGTILLMIAVAFMALHIFINK